MKKNSGEARQKWMESIARIKLASTKKEEVEKELNVFLNNIRIKQMHNKLTFITKGPRSGLDYIQVPTKVWYYSPKTHELFRHTLGVFECYRPTTPNSHDYPRSHTLKVIEDDAVEAKVDDLDKSGPRLVEHYPDKRTM